MLKSLDCAEELNLILHAKRYHPQACKSIARKKAIVRNLDSSERLSNLSNNHTTNAHLTACLSPGSEACCIMIGRVEVLSAPVYYLVRLAVPRKMSGLIEVDAPVRFVFLMLTKNADHIPRIYQIARCFASLLRDVNFKQKLYSANRGRDLYLASNLFRKNMLIVSTFPEIISKGDGIQLHHFKHNSVNYDRQDLVFADITDPTFRSSNSTPGFVTEITDPPIECRLSMLKNFCPPFRELFKGISVLLSRMPSDYIDAFTGENLGTMLSSILFIYFVVFGPAITFGNLMLTQVHHSFSINLNIFSCGVYTIIYSLLAGQPLSSIGPSGPGFIFETIIASFAFSLNADFAVYRFLVGTYTSMFGLILIALNLSPLASYARRSAEELFSSFISLFLILKAVFSMFKSIPKDGVPLSTENATYTDLLKAIESSQSSSQAAASLFLALCMLVFCLCVNMFKRSHFIRRTFRYWVGAFNVPLGIIFVTILEKIFFENYNVKKLDIPSARNFNISSLVNIVNFSQVATFIGPAQGELHQSAAFMGFFTALLFFTETALNSMTALKPKAKKPSPFVMDQILTVVLFPVLSGILGWPFVSGVPVRTIANTMALVKVDPHPPPGKSAEIICLVEQRVSVLAVGVLVTVSVFLGDILQNIPIAALYGMFVYLGINGLRGLDSVSALLALLTRKKYWSKWEFLVNLPKLQLLFIVVIHFSELALLILCIVLAEFTSSNYVALITPFVLIGSGLLREFVLPRFKWLQSTLGKVDKRCLPSKIRMKFIEKDVAKMWLDKPANGLLGVHESSAETLIF